MKKALSILSIVMLSLTLPLTGYAAPKKACNIKGNISYTTGEKIYHVPGGQYYKKTIIDTSAGEKYFCSESEARKSGWRKSMR